MKKNKLDSIPKYCCIALLESCFMHCRMCYKWEKDVNQREPDEPSLEQWKEFITDFAQMYTQKKPQINFAGGEPLAREETLSLIEFAVNLGFDTLLATNGYLINEQLAKKIGSIGLKNISISLDGINKSTHDFLRGVNDGYERVMQAINLLHAFAPKVEIDIATAISAVNLNEIADIVKWVNRDERINGIGFQAITQPFSTLTEDKWYENPKYSFLWPKDTDMVNKVIDELIELKFADKERLAPKIKNPSKQFQMYKNYFQNPESFIKKEKCHLSQEALNITPAGEVHICFYKPSIGNIKSASIKTLWFSDTADRVREDIKKCRKNCQALVNCNFDADINYDNQER
ncbi:MAG: radical SAM protein [Candidatus Omnitrophota bacterium]